MIGRRTVVVELLEPDGWTRRDYDIGVFFVGFETRSTHIAKRLSARTTFLIASGFSSNRERAYRDNIRWALSARSDLSITTDDGFADEISPRLIDAVRALGDLGRPVRMWIDTSSCSRKRLAALVLAVGRLESECECDAFYIPGTFTRPSVLPELIAIAEPVLPELAGWSDASSPLAAIIGIGFETVQTIGALDYLDPAESWLLRPRGADERYDRAVDRMNHDLLERSPEEHVVDYAVERPDILFVTLESMVESLVRDHRVVLVPFGPKVFALVTLLVAWMYDPIASVWRFSAGVLAPPVDVLPSSVVIAIRIEFRCDP